MVPARHLSCCPLVLPPSLDTRAGGQQGDRQHPLFLPAADSHSRLMLLLVELRQCHLLSSRSRSQAVKGSEMIPVPLLPPSPRAEEEEPFFRSLHSVSPGPWGQACRFLQGGRLAALGT